MIFQELSGVEEREANSPSFFNTDEVNMRVNYVTKLLQTQSQPDMPAIPPSDIGIIAPYRKQVRVIQRSMIPQLLKLHDGWKLPSAGSLKVRKSIINLKNNPLPI